MNNFEEEYNYQIRMLNQAEEILDDYQNQLYRKNTQLSEWIASFNRDASSQQRKSTGPSFGQNTGELESILKQKRKELEETRYQVQQEFNRKMNGF